LSAEKTPTLWGTLPAFEALLVKLQEYRDGNETGVELYDIMNAGMEKLEEYKQETTTVPAYILSMCKFFIF
jgi:hypothetical protein